MNAAAKSMIAGLALAAAAPLGAQRVVFVCEHGTVKSLVAVEYFNKLARERGLAVEAISRGTNPDPRVPMVVANGLTADGFDIRDFQPKRFAAGDLANGLLVVALDADVSDVMHLSTTPVVRWDGLPSVTADYAGARTAIASRVSRLIDSLAAQRGGAKPQSKVPRKIKKATLK